MKKRFFTSRKFFLLTSFFLLLIASYLSFVLPPQTKTIIPFPQYTVSAINIFSALLSVLFIFKENWRKGQYFILLIQSISTILYGYDILGIFLYMALIVLLFCDGCFKNNFHKKVVLLLIIWAICILGLIPFGLNRVLFSYAVLIFFIGFYSFIFSELKLMLSQLLPPSKISNHINLPKPGSIINLHDYNLTARQITFVNDYIKEALSYKQISEKYFVSLSTVKCEMAFIFKKFGVKNKEDLRILLLQYIISF